MSSESVLSACSNEDTAFNTKNTVSEIEINALRAKEIIPITNGFKLDSLLGPLI